MADAHIQLGRVLAADHKYDEAIAEMQAAAKLAPADAGARAIWRTSMERPRNIAEAEATYRALLPASPEIRAPPKAGQTLIKQKKFPAAAKEFMAAVKLKPDWGEAYTGLAFAASEAKDYPLAIKALDMRAKFFPERSRISCGPPPMIISTISTGTQNYHLFLNTANGKYPDQEWQAKHRLIAIEPKK